MPTELPNISSLDLRVSETTRNREITSFEDQSSTSTSNPVTATETRLRQAAMEAQRETQRRGVSVRLDYDPRVMCQRMRIDIDRSCTGFEIRGEELERRDNHDIAREYTSRAVAEITRHLEAQIYSGIRDVLEAQRRPQRPGSIGWDMVVAEELMSACIRGDAAMMAGSLSRYCTKEPPKKEKFYKWMKELPKEIKTATVTAVPLDSNKKVYEEAQLMGHCLWRDYEERIKKGKYLAFHVTPPKDICKTGITAGFKRIDSTGGWKFDMAEGKARSKHEDPRLQEIYDNILSSLNKGVKVQKQTSYREEVTDLARYLMPNTTC